MRHRPSAAATRRASRAHPVRIVLATLVALAGLAFGQSPDAAPLDPDRLAAFFDEVVPASMAEHRVPGLIVTVVADGQVRLATGYGLAELEPERPATADTLFATGSVAKLFTWTAVMQLVERGELDLDADVNGYLDFELPAYQGEAITLRHLLTHTPGFEDYPMIGLFTRDAERLPELGEVVASRIPERIWSPGVETAYSNYGSGLAGYIVERVSGVPFAQYVEAEILAPLGMTRSSFRQPLPPDLAETAALGYLPDGEGGFVPGGAEYVALVPAGGMVMSAADAARFMLAHLQGGALDGARILQPETVERMHTTLFRNDPTLPGNAYGFWESERHGERILQHGGDTQLFHTQLALLPERGVGIYFATNAVGGALLREDLWEAFLDRFYPAAAVTAAADVSAAELAAYAGSYGTNRASTSSMAKVVALFQTLQVRVEGERLVTSFVGMEHTWLPQGNGRFADVDREGEVALFRRGDDGRTAAYFSEAPMMVFRPLRWFETPLFNLVLLIGAAALLLSALIAVPLLAWLARRRGDSKDVAARRARWLGLAAALLALGFVGLFFAAMADPMGPAFGVSPLLATGLTTGIVAALAIAAYAIAVIFAWLLDWWRTGERIYATVVAVAGLALLWQMNYWNLLGFRI